VKVPVLTAVTGAPWEAELVAELDRADRGVRVVRRCVDLAELLSIAATGTARVALLSADLRRLDRVAVDRLAAAGVAVVGLVDPGDDGGGHRLRQIGVQRVLPADAGVEAVSAAVSAAVAEPPPVAGPSLGDPGAALSPFGPVVAAPPPPRGRGTLVAVWGPTGAPGRTTVAVGLADETARLGVSTLLVDADVYGGVVAPMLGLLDESAGLAGACRAAAAGRLDVAALARLSLQVAPTLRVLTGPSRADRWPELRPSAVRTVLDQARHLAATTVLDCGFCLEQDEELSYDIAAPRRNGGTIAVLEAADTVVCVGAADPVGLQRLARGIAELREVVPGVEPLVVVNRVRSTVVPGDPRQEIAAALRRWAGITDAAYLPWAPTVTDTAVKAGATVAEVAPASPLRHGLIELARRLAGVPAQPPTRRRVRLLGRRAPPTRSPAPGGS
jgi:Flp pilus assembly CpaE family ATPase